MTNEEFERDWLGCEVDVTEQLVWSVGKSGVVVGFDKSRPDCVLLDMPKGGFDAKLGHHGVFPRIPVKHRVQLFCIDYLGKPRRIGNSPVKRMISATPSRCYCGSPAYVTALTVECTSRACRHYREGR